MVNEFPYSFHTSKRQRGHSVAHERPEGLLEARTSGGRAATIALVIRQTRVRILANITLFHIRNNRKETTSYSKTRTEDWAFDSLTIVQ